jgi:hypothetical protein
MTPLSVLLLHAYIAFGIIVLRKEMMQGKVRQDRHIQIHGLVCFPLDPWHYVIVTLLVVPKIFSD